MTDKDIEIVDLRGRINSLEILGKRYETRIRELEAALRDAQNRILQVTEPWRGARADITPAAVAAIVPLLNEWQCLLRSAPSACAKRYDSLHTKLPTQR